jgi:ribose/xylose/arabinose/galactoside ABC-type transport system permease subunit
MSAENFKTFFATHGYVLQCAGFLAVMALIFSVASPYFLSFENTGNILTASCVIGLMAIGATFVIGSGGIDLSTASAMALASVVAATCVQHFGLSPAAAVLICIGVGAVCGFLNGFLINVTGAPSFIVTLGMLSVARAGAYIISNGVPIYGLPDPVTNLGQGLFWNVPAPVWFFVIGCAIAGYLLFFSVLGRHTLVLGDNPEAARSLGVPVNTLRLKIYALAGAFSGLAGFIFMARTNAGDPAAGTNYELMAITAVILGGASLFGGRATIIGTILGVLCLGVLQNGLNLLAISTFYQVLFVGLVLIGAAFLRRDGAK